MSRKVPGAADSPSCAIYDSDAHAPAAASNGFTDRLQRKLLHVLLLDLGNLVDVLDSHRPHKLMSRPLCAALNASSNKYAKGIAWVQNEYTPLAEARVPLLDQGFMHSDLTYDVPSVWDGRYFRLDDHLSRLEASCAKIRMRFPLPREEIKRLLIEMVALSGIKDAFVEITVALPVAYFSRYVAFERDAKQLEDKRLRARVGPRRLALWTMVGSADVTVTRFGHSEP